jgi:hypothetical protein
MAFKETANERMFLIEDLAAVEVTVGLRAKIYEGQALSELMQNLTPSASGWPQRTWQIPCFSQLRNNL